MSGKPIACDLTALNADERERRSVIASKVHSAVVGRRELTNGYALRIASDKVSLDEIDEWTKLEGKCCPFLDFAVASEDGALWLNITGGAGVKEFLKAEMSGS